MQSQTAANFQPAPISAYLLTWNPATWQWSTMAQEVVAVREGRLPENEGARRWSCGNNGQIRRGDRLFLFKQGEPPRGIVGSARATSDVYERPHWDPNRAARGDTAKYVDLRFDTLINVAATSPMNPSVLPPQVADAVNWSTPSSGISIPPDAAAGLEHAWNDYLHAVESAGERSDNDDFLGVLRRYQRERTIFQSTKYGKRYHVVLVDDELVEVHRVDANDPEQCTLDWYRTRAAQVRAAGGSLSLNDLEGTVAKRMTFVQSARFGLSPDKRRCLDLAAPGQALANFCSVLKALDVDRTSGQPKLYKPLMTASVIHGIESGELTENRITFDWVLPRVLERAQAAGVDAAPEQAAMAFYHLTGDQFWLLCYNDFSQLIDSGGVSPSAIRQRVAHAKIKDTYWQAIQTAPARARALQALEEQWWPDESSSVRPRPSSGFWWVNQGHNYNEERRLGIIWAPQQNKNGTTFFHWTNVSRVRTGDCIFNYANGAIRSVSIAMTDGVAAQRPPSLSDGTDTRDGWMAKLDYHDLPSPIPLARIGEQVRALNLERGPLNSEGRVNQAYLFEISDAAAEIIALEANPNALPKELTGWLVERGTVRVARSSTYTLDDALDGLFIPKAELEALLVVWRRKKNAILQGPPGVGKTFVAKRLAYVLMGEKDTSRVAMVQFHQSYAYEDFVQGWRPKEEGGFFLRTVSSTSSAAAPPMIRSSGRTCSSLMRSTAEISAAFLGS